ncbi:MAG TPA: septation regulator SpoVG [Nitrospirota bacterium]|jgi:stage V sporulation protein G
MDVTEVKVFPVSEDKLKAYVTITLDNSFVVRDLKIIEGKTGHFVAMPSKKRKDGTYRDMAHPLNTETRDMIESKVMAEYEREVGKLQTEQQQQGN